MPDSISRQFARWAVGLKYEDLPPAVVDKVQALLFHHLVAAVFGAQLQHAQEAIYLVKAEEGKPDGATVIYDGSKVTRAGAAWVNAELTHRSGMFDSFRMITHPGPMLVPPALANAELGRKSGRDLIVALAAGYEVMTRLANDFVPSTGARGFRPSPIFGTPGAAVAGAMLMDVDEDQMVSAIALGATMAAGTNEGPRTGGGETFFHDPNAARNGAYASLLAKEVKGAETSIEGRAGFYNAFTGSHTGELSYDFLGRTQADIEAITANLGQHWELLNVMFRMYPTAGFNQPVIDLLAEMKQQHAWDPDAIQDVAVRMNWIETLYPSPAFPNAQMYEPGVGSTHYFAAHAAVNGGFPQVGGRNYGPTGDRLEEDQRVLDFIPRVRLVAEQDRAMFSPGVEVTMRDGTVHSGEYPYERMAWDFDQLLERLEDPAENYPLFRPGYDALLEAVRNIDSLATVDRLFELTTRPVG